MNSSAMIFLGMGVECAVAVYAGHWLGTAADAQFGGRGIGAALGAVIGLVGWFIHLLQVVKKFDSDDTQAPKQ